jgi:hypothetical protein
MHEEMATGQAAIRDKAAKAATESTAIASSAKQNAARAKENIQRLKQGESVAGGLDKPIDVRTILKEAGWTDADMRAACEFHELTELVAGKDEKKVTEFIDRLAVESVEASRRADRRNVRKLLKGVKPQF